MERINPVFQGSKERSSARYFFCVKNMTKMKYHTDVILSHRRDLALTAGARQTCADHPKGPSGQMSLRQMSTQTNVQPDKCLLGQKKTDICVPGHLAPD